MNVKDRSNWVHDHLHSSYSDQIQQIKFLDHVLKAITVHALVQVSTWSVVVFQAMRLWMCRVSIDAKVCLINVSFSYC